MKTRRKCLIASITRFTAQTRRRRKTDEIRTIGLTKEGFSYRNNWRYHFLSNFFSTIAPVDIANFQVYHKKLGPILLSPNIFGRLQFEKQSVSDSIDSKLVQ